MVNAPVIKIALDELDLVDLEILWWIVELERATSKILSDKVYLSRQAILHRVRKKVDMGLASSQSVVIAKGIKPAEYFFPAPELTKLAIENAIATLQSKVKKGRRMGEQKSEGLHPVGILMLGLILHGVAETVPDFMRRLGCNESMARDRAREIEERKYVFRTRLPKAKGQKGARKYAYRLSSSLSKEGISNALARVSLDTVNGQLILDPDVNWEDMGVQDYRDYLTPTNFDVKGNELSEARQTDVPPNKGRKPKATNFKAVAESNGHKTAAESQLELAPQQHKTSEQEIWAVLRTMAEKLAEYEERLARLESRPQDTQVQRMSAEILAIIPPVAKKEAS